MRDKGFDQLPVLSPSRKLIGLITLGNCLSWISQGRATAASPVEDVMFSFKKMVRAVADPRDLESMMRNTDLSEDAASLARKSKRSRFMEITLDTPLQALNGFFEWNSAAVVTERDEIEEMRPIGVVTKVDLLTWLMKQEKV